MKRNLNSSIRYLSLAVVLPGSLSVTSSTPGVRVPSATISPSTIYSLHLYDPDPGVQVPGQPLIGQVTAMQDSDSNWATAK